MTIYRTGTTLGGKRKHHPSEVGDSFGGRVVIRLLPRDRTSNERVAWKCKHCGDHGSGYVFNLRNAKPHCAKAVRS